MIINLTSKKIPCEYSCEANKTNQIKKPEEIFSNRLSLKLSVLKEDQSSLKTSSRALHP